MDKIKKYLFLAGIILVILCFWGIYTLKSTNINPKILQMMNLMIH